MPVKIFRLEEGSEQEKFVNCRNKIALFTGGYGNGKTAGLAVGAAIKVASEYEGARVLVGRATRPKLEDSTKPELIKWLPEDWVVDWPSDRKNNIVLKNKSRIEFRHIRQEGKGKGEEQSNLLSATYDCICVDQLDDPEFSYKDFADLVGRLRGTARYTGDDPTMPRVGPQWFRGTANPTRNWLFREVVNPYFVYKKSGLRTQKLLVNRRTGKVVIDVFNAPTQANSRNTGEEYAETMEIVFRGSMGKRFIEGDWSAYEGLVYPDYDDTVHVVQHERLAEFIRQKILTGEVGVLESYDYGQAVPSCYLLAFIDEIGNVFIVDGYYQALFAIKAQATRIKEIRNSWGIIPREPINADPDIFRKKNATSTNTGISISQMFEEEKIEMQRGANAIEAGIAKVSSYLQVDKMHRHPITGNYGAPRLYVSSQLEFLQNEFADYYWNKNTLGQNVDKPRDVNDHAMDALKYLFSRQAKVIGMVRPALTEINPAIFAWHEAPERARDEFRPRHR